jgi:hypothetical protein
LSKALLALLRGFAEFHFGIPRADWLRSIMNHIDPDLFMDCFTSWVAECWPDKLDPVAIDGNGAAIAGEADGPECALPRRSPELLEDLALQQLRSRGVIVRM